MSTNEPVTPQEPGAQSSMPEIDRLRLEVTTFLYAAVFGYGFQVFDLAPWGKEIQPDNWAEVLRELGLYWAGLALYFWVFGFIAVDWMFIRQIYFKEKAYGAVDFVIDLLIAFFFARMFHDAVFAVNKDGNPVNFGYWYWFGWVFLAYLCWDGVRVWRSYRSTSDRPGALWAAIRGQLRTIIADSVTLVLVMVVYSLGARLKTLPAFDAIVLATPVLYGVCVYCWYRDAQTAPG